MTSTTPGAKNSTCPLCSARGDLRLVKHGHPVFRCSRCAHEWTPVTHPETHVASVYSDAYFHGSGEGYADYLADGALLEARGRWYARLLRRWLTPGRLLDVGAAAGFILKGFEKSGWNGVGLEPNDAMADFARKRGLDVRTTTIEDFQSADPFDLIIFIQVLAHFVDPAAALARAAELTRPGGCWLIESWDRASWSAWLFGRHWHEYNPPSVLHWFTAAGLRKFARRFGMRVVEQGRACKPISVRHARGLLAPKLAASPWTRPCTSLLSLLPERAVLPYPGDDLFWLLLRKSPAA